jgi:hypothetical protein
MKTALFVFFLVFIISINGNLSAQLSDSSFETWENAVVKLTRAEREALVLGDYIPNETNTGLLPGWTISMLERVLPTSGNHVSLAPGLYENKIFWCEVRIAYGTAPVIFRNCVFAGPNPDAIGDATGGGQLGRDGGQGLRCWGSTIFQWEMYDSKIDPSVWFDASNNPPDGACSGNMSYKLRHIIGIAGGSGTVRRCEITNVGDGIGIIQTAENDADVSFYTIEGNWIHKMIFYKGAGHHQPEGTHADGIQFHTGRNITIRGNRIGGAYSPDGYAQDPSYNLGDDIYNAGIMLQQEVSSDNNHRLENILIEKNLFEGGRPGGYNINHSYKFTTNHATTRIRDNKFILRSPTHYVIRPSAWANRYINNKFATWNVEGVSITVGNEINYNNGNAAPAD